MQPSFFVQRASAPLDHLPSLSNAYWTLRTSFPYSSHLQEFDYIDSEDLYFFQNLLASLSVCIVISSFVKLPNFLFKNWPSSFLFI